jgi:DNA-binding NarL/FixJ family response regulator
VTITVFVADDHAVLRDGLKLLLAMQPDIRVVGEAADGRAAVRGVSQASPDVVILDIFMPEMNGIEAIAPIQQACPAAKVIILSMNSDAEHVFRALQAGARGYLVKASAGAEVVAAVRAVHAGRRYLSADISDHIVDSYLRQREAAFTASPLAKLSPREHEILQLLVEGHSNTHIANRLCLSSASVKTYRSRLMRKLGVDDMPGLVKFAILHGLIPLQ